MAKTGQEAGPTELDDGAGAGRDVAIFQAFVFFSGYLGCFDGGVVNIRVLEADLHDGVVVNGPDFEVGGNVRGIAGLDEVDFVGSIIMIAAGAGVGGVSLVAVAGRNGRWVDATNGGVGQRVDCISELMRFTKSEFL